MQCKYGKSLQKEAREFNIHEAAQQKSEKRNKQYTKISDLSCFEC